VARNIVRAEEESDRDNQERLRLEAEWQPEADRLEEECRAEEVRERLEQEAEWNRHRDRAVAILNQPNTISPAEQAELDQLNAWLDSHRDYKPYVPRELRGLE
jgi:hypothetical protein